MTGVAPHQHHEIRAQVTGRGRTAGERPDWTAGSEPTSPPDGASQVILDGEAWRRALAENWQVAQQLSSGFRISPGIHGRHALDIFTDALTLAQQSGALRLADRTEIKLEPAGDAETFHVVTVVDGRRVARQEIWADDLAVTAAERAGAEDRDQTAGEAELMEFRAGLLEALINEL